MRSQISSLCKFFLKSDFYTLYGYTKTSLRGDSCHPMLPYLAQGANSAIEDGAVLGLLLGHIKSKDQLPQALNMYQSLRKTRGERIVKETFKQVSTSRPEMWFCM